ncbi:interleukin-17C-like [Thunnus maccoyii]|uniref:interleukin-17C-like n=1 Tax=Thunnus maccoyii TaxID=8240 RepID=UPI001C4D325E|nr:interleukin-17C-like [Thunnus maccoyii]
MTWVSLQMISLGSLLFLNDQISASRADKGPRRIRIEKFENTTGLFLEWHQRKLKVISTQQLDRGECVKAVNQMHGDPNKRSLSPWEYSTHRDDSRFPNEISVAKCLCRGCIINKKENHNYNSVPVFAPLTVLKKTLLQRNPDKYRLTFEVIKIPVACTCVVPQIN